MSELKELNIRLDSSLHLLHKSRTNKDSLYKTIKYFRQFVGIKK